jgi:hypothetical protein
MQQMVEGDDEGQMDEEHMMHAYAQPPVRRRQQRIQSPRKAPVHQPLPGSFLFSLSVIHEQRLI